MDRQCIQVPPFSVHVLESKLNNVHATPPGGHISLDTLLPASYRIEVDSLPRLYTPDLCDVAFLEQELNLQRLNSIIAWLWVAGRPMPPRPLHYQLLLGREIFVAERMDMHLVWTTGRIFLKPIPRFLLEPSFWTDHLSCPQGCPCPKDTNADTNYGAGTLNCRQGLRARGLGFLSSYAALIGHESDFLIAQEKYLLPKEIKWLAWRTLVRQILEIGDIDRKIDARFIYGELRLSRLNKIYMLSRRPFLRGYMTHWQQYKTYFQDNLAWLASATVYIAIVLTAMQVGLATSLAENRIFQAASYGFTVFSLLGPLIAAALIILVFCYMFVDNWVEMACYRKKRFRVVQAASAGS